MTAAPSGQLIYRAQSLQIKLVFATGMPRAFLLIDPHDRSAAGRVWPVFQTVPSATGDSGSALRGDSGASSFAATCESKVAAGSRSAFQA